MSESTTFMFATCETGRALEFLAKAYPNHSVSADMPEVAAVIDLIEKDILRIQDPMMHPTTQIVPGNNWEETPEHRAHCASLCQSMHDAIMASPKRTNK